MTEPTIQDGVDRCVEAGYTDISALPVLLFAARHNKFDVTNELDRARQRHPQIRFHYGRHFGIAPEILALWRDRLTQLDTPAYNPRPIQRQDTVLLFVGRGASDPDANGDVYKLARIVWEGSGYDTVETCFIGITHPRLEEGFRRARLYQPKRIIVLPYFLFTGVLMKKNSRHRRPTTGAASRNGSDLSPRDGDSPPVARHHAPPRNRDPNGSSGHELRNVQVSARCWSSPRHRAQSRA